MAHTQDSIPHRDADFDGWFKNLKNYIVEKTGGTPPDWTHIPPERVLALTKQYVAWNTAYAKILGPHTAVDTEAKQDARKASEALLRPFINQFLRYDPVTDEDRTAMGIHNHDTTRTEIGVPTTRALLTDLRALGGFQVEIHFQDEATPTSRAIPYGCNGCILYHAWGPERLTVYAALTDTRLMTRSPWTLTLPPEAERTYLSCAARWQNEKGELGPWSEIAHVVIA